MNLNIVLDQTVNICVVQAIVLSTFECKFCFQIWFVPTWIFAYLIKCYDLNSILGIKLCAYVLLSIFQTLDFQHFKMLNLQQFDVHKS